MELKVELSGKVLEKLRTAPEEVRGEVQNGIRDASTFLMEAVIREAPASTGTLRKSIRRELHPLRAIISPTVDYAPMLHGDGTSQRSAPFSIPSREAMPGGSLYRWAKKKGMNPWAVRASIRRRGIRHNPFLIRTAKANEAGVKKIFIGVVNKITKIMAD